MTAAAAPVLAQNASEVSITMPQWVLAVQRAMTVGDAAPAVPPPVHGVVGADPGADEVPGAHGAHQTTPDAGAGAAAGGSISGIRLGASTVSSCTGRAATDDEHVKWVFLVHLGRVAGGGIGVELGHDFFHAHAA